MHVHGHLFGQMLQQIWTPPMPSGLHSDHRRKIGSRTMWVEAVSEKSVEVR